jgi:DNA-binding CsgD family transcriptional regulator
MDGETIKGAAVRLRCSRETAKFHLTNVRRKIHAVSIVHAVSIIFLTDTTQKGS